MKNIRVHEFFLSNIGENYRVCYYRISLLRTYVFNVNGNEAICFRKRNERARRIHLLGIEKHLKVNDKNRIKKIKLKKGKMRKIDQIIYEYIDNDEVQLENDRHLFDIANRDKKNVVIDSVIRKVKKDELITMHFDGKSRKKTNEKMVWINSNNNYNFMSRIN